MRPVGRGSEGVICISFFFSPTAVTLKSDLEEEEEDGVTSDAVCTTVDLRTKEPREEEEARVSMTGRAHSAGPQTSFQGPKMADESQVGSASNVSRLDECVSNSV